MRGINTQKDTKEKTIRIRSKLCVAHCIRSSYTFYIFVKQKISSEFRQSNTKKKKCHKFLYV